MSPSPRNAEEMRTPSQIGQPGETQFAGVHEGYYESAGTVWYGSTIRSVVSNTTAIAVRGVKPTDTTIATPADRIFVAPRHPGPQASQQGCQLPRFCSFQLADLACDLDFESCTAFQYISQ